MWIIIDKRTPEPAKERLSSFGNLLELESNNIVYDAISGHPDIFLCQTDKQLIIAPNTPQKFVDKLKDCKINFTFGNFLLGLKYPETARYNAVIMDKYLIHNLKFSDQLIIKCCKNKTHIHVEQAYTRCNLIALGNDNFITSDKGIERSLKKNHLNVLFVNPIDVELQGFSNGFLGGCCGVFDKNLFVNGCLKYLSEKVSFLGFAKDLGFTIIELYDGPLVDVGGIFFVKP
jgi:hypothetical protein